MIFARNPEDFPDVMYRRVQFISTAFKILTAAANFCKKLAVTCTELSILHKR